MRPVKLEEKIKEFVGWEVTVRYVLGNYQRKAEGQLIELGDDYLLIKSTYDGSHIYVKLGSIVSITVSPKVKVERF